MLKKNFEPIKIRIMPHSLFISKRNRFPKTVPNYIPEKLSSIVTTAMVTSAVSKILG
jgi:hypothetical protein